MKKLVAVILLFFILLLSPPAVTILWDRNVETNVVGYRVYSGRVSRAYDSVFDVGNVTNAVIPTVDAVTYLAVTAYDNEGLESGYSNEVIYSSPTNQPPVTNYPPVTNILADSVIRVRRGAQNKPEFFIQARAGVTYSVDITFDFIIWYPYINLTRETDGEVSIPLYTTSYGNAFFRFFHNSP